MHRRSRRCLVRRASKEDAEVPKMLSLPQEANARGRMDAVVELQRRMGAQGPAVGLVHVELGVRGVAEELHCCQGWAEVCGLVDVEDGVIGMLLDGRGRGPSRQRDGPDGSGGLEVVEVRVEGLATDVVLEGREGAALGHAGRLVESSSA